MSAMWTADEILEQAATFRKVAQAAFVRDGYQPPIAFVFATQPAGALLVVTAKDPPATSVERDGLAAAVEHLARKHLAIAVMLVFEGWTFEGSSAREHPRGKSIAEHPDRKSVLYCHLERHGAAPLMWLAPTQGEGRGATVGEWGEPRVMAESRGRFMHLLGLTS